ncbi:hypothetical protein ILUMI_08662 [Ignelater luminosus]|uniref:Fatty acyl-CoA reductase n=1 Tax=Ignelater luminosus TaxID=2038154 RepID=A0A8K0D5A4_IGNLU|nr:hypothetical protein ILUMI_08662 [Ignelater luminosus]
MSSGSIKEFYAGRSIFITGATGFIGKVLIEKILRSCPKVDKIYALIRPKRGKTPEERLRALTNLPLFDKLKEQYPDAIEKKLRAITGDTTEIGLGLSEEDKKELVENISIIFHGAASVRFNDSLRKAVIMNTRGTREVIELGYEMKKLEVFLHTSTTYCHTDKAVVAEQLYPAHADWRKTIEIAENMDEHVLQTLTSKYITPLPNTYTFTKSLAEHVVNDMCKDRIPAVIMRPSIVISTRNDPIIGWVDNYMGPMGMLVACGKGILRTSYSNPNTIADYMPVDMAVRALLMSAWQKGISTNLEEKFDVTVYNCSNNNMCSITMWELLDFGKQIFWEAPSSKILWFPGGSMTNCRYWNYLRVIFLHLLPAVIVDCILRVLNKKPILVTLQRRIYIANLALHYFITNEWKFLNDRAFNLERKLIPEEVQEFEYDIEHANVYEYFKNCIIHGRRYLLKEDDSTLESAKVNLYRMYVLDRMVNIMFYIFLYWFMVYKLNIFMYIDYKFNRIYNGIMGY